MSADFPVFAELLTTNTNAMYASNREYYYVDIDRDEMWEQYLASFPPGSNEIYRERTEHDCSCCRHFIKNIGAMIQIKDNTYITIWDECEHLPEPYLTVASMMRELIQGYAIKNMFRKSQSRFGVNQTLELLDNGDVKRWNHFSTNLPTKLIRNDINEFEGNMKTTYDVFSRGLSEITMASLQDIIGLINDDMLYRGAEFLKDVQAFRDLKNEWMTINNTFTRDIFIWKSINNRNARFRNTVIGTLAVDLSTGEDLTVAVKKFESKVAPENYKRSKSLITPAMIDAALTTLRAEGLESSLDRRHAQLSDVAVTDVLWASYEAQNHMRDGLRDLLIPEAVTKVPSMSGAKEISADDFLMDVLPKADEVWVKPKSSHVGNFMSITAPEHEDDCGMFKWGNNFAWSYDGELTDSSITKRVAKAGGRVVGAKMRVSLAWTNTDDLDIHCNTPDGKHIYFYSPQGVLDVDMNASNLCRDPVENLSWTELQDGIYKISVDQFTRRESVDVGFDLEVENNGRIIHYRYDNPVCGRVNYLDITVVNEQITDIKPNKQLKVSGGIAIDKWGVTTGDLIKVNTIMMSPNYWNHLQVGNKHMFFILDGCLNPNPVRSIYNEFLSNKFAKHRKVMEVLGAKTMCEYSTNQLSGLGFSSTVRNDLEILVQYKGRKTPYKVLF